MLLLDTCALLWLASDHKNLSKTAKAEIKSNSKSLFVSAITAFEIAVKCRSGKLKLPLPPSDWYSESLAFHGIREVPVTGQIASNSVQLPPFHNDPCDRIIIATAQINTMKILTCDSLISKYSQANVVW